MDVGGRIKELRIEKNLSQAELASLLGVDKSTIAKYETNSREPKAYILCKIADFFEITVDYLLDREGVF